MGFHYSSQVNQGIKYQIPVTQTRNPFQLFLKPFLSAGESARFDFLGSKIDFSKWLNPVATNEPAVASGHPSISLSVGENCTPQPDKRYLLYTPTVWSGVWPVGPSSSASQVYWPRCKPQVF